MIFLEDEININLLEETITELENYGRTTEDVLLITCDQENSVQRIGFSWEEFAAVADNVYYNGFGAQEVNPSLRIIGDNWWMSRTEYDGKESWRFNTMPSKMSIKKPPTIGDIFEKGFDERAAEYGIW
jgi:hypothetical protein